ncbi:MAG: TVP38/TMEM64 family protein [Firmicutes bacterium]|nr:TVP38/TMEM64 family protein [Bacillota bacterium]
MTKRKAFLAIAKLALLLFIVMGIPLSIYWNHPEILEHFRSLEALNAFLDRYHTTGIFVYLFLQILQILVPVIPGQAMQLAAGYMYILPLALFLTILGIALGTIISFTMSRILGYDAMVLFFGQERMDEYVLKLNSKRAYLVIFLLYLMPGFPKDFICFAAGVSRIRLIPFLVLSVVGRIPALTLSLVIGRMTRAGSYTGAIVVCVVAVVLFLVCIWKRQAVMDFSDRIYEQYMKK